MQAAMFKKMAGDKLDKFKEDNTDSEVDWQDYNYPSFLKLIHFSLDSVPEEKNKKWAKLLHMSFLGWVIYYALNFLINVIGCAINYKKFGFMPMIYTIFHAFLFVPGGLLTFYKGFRVICKMKDEKWYRI